MFQLHALPAEPFRHLFDLSDAELERAGAQRALVDAKPGYPCRISLADAEVGETVILVNHVHQPAETPFHSSHAIFVREGVEQARPEVGEIPEFLRSRLLSVRAFSDADQMVDGVVVEGTEIDAAIERLFDDPDVEYLHLHNAQLGCYAARATRAPEAVSRS